MGDTEQAISRFLVRRSHILAIQASKAYLYDCM